MSKIKEVLSAHGVIAFPTETVCGLGILFNDEIAFEKLNKIKGKRENKPYTLMLSKSEDIYTYAYVNELAKKVIDKFVPGDVTLLLKAKENLPYFVTLGSEFIGVRVSGKKMTRDIIEEAGVPLLVPSLNRSNEKPFIDISIAKEYFKDEIDLYIDGVSDNRKPSTIIKIDDKIEMIRQGDISLEEILKATEE